MTSNDSFLVKASKICKKTKRIARWITQLRKMHPLTSKFLLSVITMYSNRLKQKRKNKKNSLQGVKFSLR